MNRLTTIAFVLLSALRMQAQVDKVTVVLSDTVKLTLHRELFDSTGKQIQYPEGVYSINGRTIFGTDGEIPKYQLTKATLTIGKNNYNLQVEDMYNPWFGDKPSNKLFFLKKEGEEYYHLRAIFSDGAGTYGAEWLIVGQSSIRTILSNDEWLMVEYLNKK